MTFPLHNIHPHQIAFMKKFEEQGGVAFIILSFTSKNETYYVPLKSATYEEIVPGAFPIRSLRDMLVHYLEPLQADLDRKG